MLSLAFGVRTKLSRCSRQSLTLAAGYYISIPVFKVWPMKKLSNLVGQLWEKDPNKSIWSLLAKAWSTMRDQIGKDNVPLDHFFQIICPYLNIPSPNTYLELQGWNLETNDEGSPILSRDPNSESLISSSAGFIDMTLSVEDIISVCQTMGYAQDYVPDRNATSPTFLARSTQGSVQDIRVAARNKRREKRRNARESGAATALRKEIDTVRNAFSDNSFQKHDHNGTGGVSLEFHNRLTELLTDPHALSNIIAQGQLHNSHVAPSQTPASHQLQLSGLYIPADHSAFRLGADENATLPHFDASSI
jgi:hypothetical protein